jgi:hypothetical protein
MAITEVRSVALNDSIRKDSWSVGIERTATILALLAHLGSPLKRQLPHPIQTYLVPQL